MLEKQIFFAIAMLSLLALPLPEVLGEPTANAATHAEADTAPQAAGEPVELPFGFRWGQNRQDITHLLAGVGVNVVSRQSVGANREVWELEGFIKPLLKGTRLYFTGDFMEEVELQFGEDTWGEVDYIRLRRKLVGQLNKLYGASRMIGSDTSREDGVAQSLIGYEWLSGDTRLRIFDFSARKESALFRRISVHYRFYDSYEVAQSPSLDQENDR